MNLWQILKWLCFKIIHNVNFSVESRSDSDVSLQDPKMFDGLTAWFSTSVAEKYMQTWGKKCFMDSKVLILLWATLLIGD